ncbi:hypothetical protein KJ819_03385 [Patescibacteria group bacterium]|nr:hypothetical protein [Patescibacteria group bacterium]MBU1500514.1 hypothetical protein [Patescibacteria group bacterium]MBU2080687.1 hypothetical protein [Patescibacteria group bacterium]MBU2123792.1 hypothetical protein [Patescibacteria group bacterium]MBU2194917.1 hypothetical protein [Patescibacteria group bacterium]
MNLARIFLDCIFPPRKTERITRSLSVEEVRVLLSPISVTPHITALLPYRTPQVSALIREAKFKDNAHAQKILGVLLHDYLKKEEILGAVFVPIPLSSVRHKARGYNQVERVLTSAGIPYVPSLLLRTRDTVPQTSLRASHRKTNLKDAFKVQGLIDPNCTYIVLDDVSTTGATLISAIETLTTAGAVKVRGITLAH